MIRFITHLVVFLVGAGIGVVWGVNHPSQAADIARHEEIASLKGQIAVLNKVGDKLPNGQQMLDDDNKKLADLQAAGN